MSSESLQILSREYTHSIKSDAKKSEILEKKLEKTHLELDSLKAQVESFRLKIKEDSATIAKLNKYVQELRNSIEKSSRIQKDSVAVQDSRHRQILTQNQLLTSQLKHAQSANADLIGEIEKLSDRKFPESTSIDHLRDAIKVKDSMLEDQADSIRKLKTNLENKCREFNNTVTELNKLRESTADATETYEKMLSTLKEDLDAIEANEIHYRKLALDYKAERDDLKVKLEERLASVSKIEEEVLRIKNHFELKEKELLASHAANLNELHLKHNVGPTN